MEVNSGKDPKHTVITHFKTQIGQNVFFKSNNKLFRFFRVFSYFFFFTDLNLKGGGEDIFLNNDHLSIEGKHFAAGATCLMYKATLVGDGKFADIPMALKELTSPLTRRIKRLSPYHVYFNSYNG